MQLREYVASYSNMDSTRSEYRRGLGRSVETG